MVLSVGRYLLIFVNNKYIVNPIKFVTDNFSTNKMISPPILCISNSFPDDMVIATHSV